MRVHFEKNWEEFIKGNMSNRPPDELNRYELARLFYEFGFSAGVCYH